jgi:hypothetical protein
MSLFRELEPVEIQFKTSESIEDCRKKIISVIQTDGWKIKVESKNDIVAGIGSGIKMRLLGAMIVGVKTSPRDVIISFKTNGDTTEIKAIVRDTLGFGSRVGFVDKLQKIMYENAFAIKNAFEDAETF